MNLRRVFSMVFGIGLLLSPCGMAHADPCTYCRVPAALLSV
ncbi:hypothetical protein [Deinococcus ruber]|nr:hypothetical protein [Deinococcus ruber]